MHSQTQDNVVLSTELIMKIRFAKRLTLEISSSETLYGGQFTFIINSFYSPTNASPHFPYKLVPLSL